MENLPPLIIAEEKALFVPFPPSYEIVMVGAVALIMKPRGTSHLRPKSPD